MSEELLVVLYQGTRAGELIRHSGGVLELRYSESYMNTPGAVPLSSSMSFASAIYRGPNLRNWLSGLLPDNESVLARWRREFGVRSTSPFALLGTAIGEDCAGAFSFIRPERVSEIVESQGSITWLTTGQIAETLRGLKSDNSNWLGTNPPGRFSLAGIQSKTALYWNGKKWGRPDSERATTHIVKPAISGLLDSDINEFLSLAAARKIGLNAAIATIEEFEDQRALFVRRYDRFEISGKQIRIHQEDLCQALGIDPALKYQQDGGPSPKDIASRLRILLPPHRVLPALESFAEGLIWNWIIGGTDAHAKNYSLLISDGDVQLAPLYDLTSTLPYIRPSDKIQLAMKFGKDYSGQLRPSTWTTIASDLSLPEAWLRDRAKQIALQAPQAIIDCAKVLSKSAQNSPVVRKLADGVAQRAQSALITING